MSDHTIVVIWIIKIFLLNSSVSSCHLFLVSSASVRSILFPSFNVPIFAWNIPLVSLIFLKTSLVFPILFVFLSFFSLFTQKGFLISPCYSLELCTRIYCPFSPLPFTSLLFSDICKASSDNQFAFLFFFFMGMVLIIACCIMLRTSLHSSSAILSNLIRKSICHFHCGSADKETAPQYRGPGFDPWVGKIPWRRERLPTPGFWPGEFHELYIPWGCKESTMMEGLSLSLFHCIIIRDLIYVIPECFSGFPYFLQFKFEFDNKEFMIWATVSSRSCFCWLYEASPSLTAKNIINLVSVLTIWWCPCVKLSLVLLEECVCYDQHVLLAKIC